MERTFPLEKVKDDWIAYAGLADKHEVVMSSYCFEKAEVRDFLISSDDEITIYGYRLDKRYLMHIFYPYSVEIIVGRYTNNEDTCVLLPEKFIATLLYNSSFELMTTICNHV
jgi:hypothetical protein